MPETRVLAGVTCRRRHLATSQQAMVAAKIATLKNGEHGKAVSNDTASIEDAAKLLNVSRPSVCRAKDVIAKGSNKLIALCHDGDVPVSTQSSLLNWRATNRYVRRRCLSAVAASVRRGSAGYPNYLHWASLAIISVPRVLSTAAS